MLDTNYLYNKNFFSVFYRDIYPLQKFNIGRQRLITLNIKNIIVQYFLKFLVRLDHLCSTHLFSLIYYLQVSQ